VTVAVPARAILRVPGPRSNGKWSWRRIAKTCAVRGPHRSVPTQRLDTRFGSTMPRAIQLSTSGIEVFRIGSRECNRTFERLE
jgi:hypothetical protein